MSGKHTAVPWLPWEQIRPAQSALPVGLACLGQSWGIKGADMRTNADYTCITLKQISKLLQNYQTYILQKYHWLNRYLLRNYHWLYKYLQKLRLAKQIHPTELSPLL